MIKIIINITCILSFLMMADCSAQTIPKISMKDFGTLSGSWQGSLTYLDYSSGKPFTMPADITVRRIKKSNKFIFSNIYPNEPNANSIDTMTISMDGKYIDKELVKARIILPGGNIEIITEEPGKDGNDNKPATIRHTYTIGKTMYKNRKDVQFAGETEWINRHEYSYKKNAGK